MIQYEKIWQKCKAQSHLQGEKCFKEGKDYTEQIFTHLSIEEYRILVEKGYQPEELRAFAPSGKKIHAYMQKHQAEKSGIDITETNQVDEHTPRYGYYKVVEKNESNHLLVCYYNCEYWQDFIEEEVEIDYWDLFSCAAVNQIASHKVTEFKKGDIIHVYEPTKKVAVGYEGRVIHLWEVYWDLIREQDYKARLMPKEEVRKIWQKCIDEYEKVRAMYDYIPVHIFTWLTNDEYRALMVNGYEPTQFLAYPPSGQKVHDTMRLIQCIIHGLPKTTPDHIIVNKIPRIGYYKLLRELNKNWFICYYNYKDKDDFIDEAVEIDFNTLFTPYSIGNTTELKAGDIIHILEPAQKITENKGKHVSSWKIVWELVAS